MSRDAGLLDDMLHEAQLALAFVKGLTEDEFARDEKTQHAVVRCFEIIGEARMGRGARPSARPDLPDRGLSARYPMTTHHRPRE
jgi:uncharacterized protein with HEPN domain